MRFSQLSQVACKLPGLAVRTLEWKLLKKFFKCFSRLEVPLARESWIEPRKSVYPSRLDLPLANKSLKLTRELAIVACDLTYPRLSRQNRVTLFFEIFSFWRTNYFPKTPKTLKKIFVFGGLNIQGCLYTYLNFHKFMFNKCHIHLCDCIWWNVFSHAQSLLIQAQKDFWVF